MPHPLGPDRSFKRNASGDSLEEIKKDLDNVDDIFSVGYSPTGPQPQVNHTQSSSSSDTDFNRSGVDSEKFQEMQVEKQRVLEEIDDPASKALMDQLLEMEIKKNLRDERANSAFRSHRENTHQSPIDNYGSPNAKVLSSSYQGLAGINKLSYSAGKQHTQPPHPISPARLG